MQYLELTTPRIIALCALLIALIFIVFIIVRYFRRKKD